MINASLDLIGIRLRNDNGSETTATWIAAQNVGESIAVDTPFRIRFLIQETAGGTGVNEKFELKHRLNGASWNHSGAATNVTRAFDSPNFTDEDPTTPQLTGGTGSFVVGAMSDDNGVAGENNQIDWNAGSEYTEVEFCVQIIGADVNHDDLVEFRVTKLNNVALEAYTVTDIDVTVIKASPVLVADAESDLGTQVANGSSLLGSVSISDVESDVALERALGSRSLGSVTISGQESDVALDSLAGTTQAIDPPVSDAESDVALSTLVGTIVIGSLLLTGVESDVATSTFLGSVSLPAQDVTLSLPSGAGVEVTIEQKLTYDSTWKYSDQNVNEFANNFHQVSFNDAAWSSAQAGFYKPPTGGLPSKPAAFIERTTLAHSTSDSRTWYFRATFSVTDANKVGRVTLRAVCDDALLVYGNADGTTNEDIIANMGPAATPPTHGWGYGGGGSEGDEGVQVTRVVSGSWVVEGTNTIACALFDANNTSSDAGFGLELDVHKVELEPPFVTGEIQLTAGAAVQDVLALPSGADVVLNEGQKTLLSGASVQVTEQKLTYASSWDYDDQNVDRFGENFHRTGYSTSGWTGNAQAGFYKSGGTLPLAPGSWVDRTTLANSGSDSRTWYFRTSFNVTDKSQVTQINLRMVSDDGAIVWGNASGALTADQIFNPDSLATIVHGTAIGARSGNNGTQLSTSLTGSQLDWLVDGSNLVAAALFDASISSSDCGFGLELDVIRIVDAPANQKVIPSGADVHITQIFLPSGADVSGVGTFPARFCEPSPMGLTETRTTIHAEFQASADAFVEYGPTAIEVDKYATTPVTAQTLFEIAIHNDEGDFSPGGLIYWRMRARAAGGGNYGASEVGVIRLARPSSDTGPWVFSIGSDIRGNENQSGQDFKDFYWPSAGQQGEEFHLCVGDFVNAGTGPSGGTATWRTIRNTTEGLFRENLKGKDLPVFNVIGNHEEDPSGDNATARQTLYPLGSFLDLAGQQNNGTDPDWLERYYYFTWGQVLFVLLDNETDQGATNANQMLSPEQQTWFVNVMEAHRNYKWKILCHHVALDETDPAHADTHTSADGMGTSHAWLIARMREYGFQLFTHGHYHGWRLEQGTGAEDQSNGSWFLCTIFGTSLHGSSGTWEGARRYARMRVGEFWNGSVYETNPDYICVEKVNPETNTSTGGVVVTRTNIGYLDRPPTYIDLPSGADVSVGGSILVSDVESDVAVDSLAGVSTLGNVSIADVESDVATSTASGSVQLGAFLLVDAEADVAVDSLVGSTTLGSISIADRESDVAVEAIAGSTNLGSIALTDAESDCALSTFNGNVDLTGGAKIPVFLASYRRRR